MANRLRHEAVQRKVGAMKEEAIDLRRHMRHDEPFQQIAGNAVGALAALERRALEVREEEEDVEQTNASLTTRSISELRRLAALGHPEAMAEQLRREPLASVA